jgi:hypothetical protein
VLTQAARRVDGWLSGIPFYPWLFAAFPVVRLYAENLTDVEPAEVPLPLLAVLVATTIGMAVVALLLREPRRAAIIVTAVLVVVMDFGLIRDSLPAALGVGSLVLLVASAAAIVLAFIVALRVRSQLGAITSALNVLSLVLIVMVAIPAAQGVADVLRTSEDPAGATANATASAAGPRRDIYHLILDRYGSERSFETGFGIDNSEFVAWLRDQGFQVVDDAHANYARTTLSVGSTLGMSLLDDLAAEAGPESQNLGPVVRRIRESRAGAFLQDLGYEYIHLGPAFLGTRDSWIADRVYYPAQEMAFTSSLYDLTVFPALLGRADTEASHAEDHAAAGRYQLGILDELRDDPGPKYVLAHILLPHPPYVFLADGSFGGDEATLRSQLTYTNASLKRFLEPLLALPEDERPIIILQADEGPYPPKLQLDQRGFDWDSATDDEVITKFGILDAWYMPGPEGAAPLPSGMTAVNTYPELFRRYFGADIAAVPDRVYASTKEAPYAMADISERLAAAELASPSATAVQPGS